MHAPILAGLSWPGQSPQRYGLLLVVLLDFDRGRRRQVHVDDGPGAASRGIAIAGHHDGGTAGRTVAPPMAAPLPPPMMAPRIAPPTAAAAILRALSDAGDSPSR